MKKMTKQILKPYIPQFILNILQKSYEKIQLIEWHKNDCPVPPPHIVKQLTIQEYQKKSQYTVLVETGTYMGYMVEAQKKKFKKIISIELGIDLFNKAIKKFKNDKNVTIVHGDSGEVLPKILLKINEPAIFWLDGHYSGGITARGETDCPIFEELGAIFNSKKLNHIFLIDDARLFTGQEDYPTINKLTEYIKSKNEKYEVQVKDDIIRYKI